MDNISKKSIINFFNYPEYGFIGCDKLENCPGKLECFVFNHHVDAIKKFLTKRYRLAFPDIICRFCFFKIYVEFARFVYYSRKGLEKDFFENVFDLYYELHKKFYCIQRSDRILSEQFFHIVCKKVFKLIKKHGEIGWGFPTECLLLYYTMTKNWAKCTNGKNPCYEHSLEF